MSAEGPGGTSEWHVHEMRESPDSPLFVKTPFGSEYVVERPAGGEGRPRVNCLHEPESPPADVTFNSMSTEHEDDRTDRGSTVFRSDAERDSAMAAFVEWQDEQEDFDVTASLVEKALDGKERAEESLLVGAREGGWRPEGCSCSEVLCPCVAQRFGVSAEDLPRDSASRENAGGSTDLPPEDDPTFADGGVDLSEMPTGTRTSFEDRRRAVERGERDPKPRAGSAANMAGIAGRMKRNFDQREDTDPDDFPGGTRSNFERRRAGLAEVPDREPSSGRRSDWKRRRNSENDPEYPVTAERARERRERREAARQHRLREAARRVQLREHLGGE